MSETSRNWKHAAAFSFTIQLTQEQARAQQEDAEEMMSA